MNTLVNVPELTQADVWQLLETVPDPEIPHISVVDLGIIRSVTLSEAQVEVVMVPTFSGCPALDHIRENIERTLQSKAEGLAVKVIVDRNQQWSTNDISAKGLEILKNFGLAAPKRYEGELDVHQAMDAHCPHCNSTDTTLRSMFGSTLCRSMHYCFDCKQSFEGFKAL